jgi:hypothetical protein
MVSWSKRDKMDVGGQELEESDEVGSSIGE